MLLWADFKNPHSHTLKSSGGLTRRTEGIGIRGNIWNVMVNKHIWSKIRYPHTFGHKVYINIFHCFWTEWHSGLWLQGPEFNHDLGLLSMWSFGVYSSSFSLCPHGFPPTLHKTCPLGVNVCAWCPVRYCNDIQGVFQTHTQCFWETSGPPQTWPG